MSMIGSLVLASTEPACWSARKPRLRCDHLGHSLVSVYAHRVAASKAQAAPTILWL